MKGKKKQVNQFDKIFKENFREPTIGLIRRLLGPVSLEAISLPTDMQRTMELKADNFFLVTTADGERFILQVEWQTGNDPKMLHRMLLYHALGYTIYNLPVKGIVIYAGKRKIKMDNYVSHYGLTYEYALINLMDMDPEELLASSAPEEILLAVLAGRTRMEQKRSVIRKVIFKLQEILKDNPAELKRRLIQFEILGSLRNIQKIIIEEEHNMAIHYNLKKDIRFQQGKSAGYFEGKQLGLSEGIVQAKTAIVKNLLKEKKYSDQQVATIAEVTLDFVQAVRKQQ